MLPQLPKGLRDGKRRFLFRNGHGNAGAPSRHAERGPADRLPQFPAGAPLRGGIRLDGWDILLPLHAVGERATVAVPDGAITVEGPGHTARVSRVIRDLNATAVVLRAAPGKNNNFPPI